MITSELLDFLRAQLQKGTSKEVLSEALLREGGWSRDDLTEAFTALAGEKGQVVSSAPDPQVSSISSEPSHVKPKVASVETAATTPSSKVQLPPQEVQRPVATIAPPSPASKIENTPTSSNKTGGIIGSVIIPATLEQADDISKEKSVPNMPASISGSGVAPVGQVREQKTVVHDPKKEISRDEDFLGLFPHNDQPQSAVLPQEQVRYREVMPPPVEVVNEDSILGRDILHPGETPKEATRITGIEEKLSRASVVNSNETRPAPVEVTKVEQPVIKNNAESIATPRQILPQEKTLKPINKVIEITSLGSSGSSEKENSPSATLPSSMPSSFTTFPLSNRVSKIAPPIRTFQDLLHQHDVAPEVSSSVIVQNEVAPSAPHIPAQTGSVSEMAVPARTTISIPIQAVSQAASSVDPDPVPLQMNAGFTAESDQISPAPTFEPLSAATTPSLAPAINEVQPEIQNEPSPQDDISFVQVAGADLGGINRSPLEIAKEHSDGTTAEAVRHPSSHRSSVIAGIAAVGALALVIALGVFAYTKFSGPNAVLALTSSFSQFTQLTSFGHATKLSIDLSFDGSGGGGTQGILKANLTTSGKLKSTPQGWGDGDHVFSFDGQLATKEIKWSTELAGEAKFVGNDLYVKISTPPKGSDEAATSLIKENWVKINMGEIMSELDLKGSERTGNYGQFGGVSKSVNGMVSMNFPFIPKGRGTKDMLDGNEVYHYQLLVDGEKALSLVRDVYATYSGKSLVVNEDEALRFKNAVERSVVELWIDSTTGNIARLRFEFDPNDVLFGVATKGKIVFDVSVREYGVKIQPDIPAPVVTLDELRRLMDDAKAKQVVRGKDNAKVELLSTITEAIAKYFDEKSRAPQTIEALRQEGYLDQVASSTSLSGYTYFPYLSTSTLTRTNRCVAKSARCDTYHIGVNLEELSGPNLSKDDDRIGEIKGSDSAGCLGEKDLYCYDRIIVLTKRSTSTSQTAP